VIDSAVSPHLAVRGGVEAMEFYKRAFSAEEHGRLMTPDGKRLMDGEVKIGDSIIMLGEENPQKGCPPPQSVGGMTVSLYLYVQDALFDQGSILCNPSNSWLEA
jgi:PhnB protein